MSILSEWSHELETTVTQVKKLAEEKNTSLYQATELLKISRPPFEFVCATLKSSFTPSDACVKRLEAFDDQFKKMINEMKSDDGGDTEGDSQLLKCLDTLSECTHHSCSNWSLHTCVCMRVSPYRSVYTNVCEHVGN